MDNKYLNLNIIFNYNNENDLNNNDLLIKFIYCILNLENNSHIHFRISEPYELNNYNDYLNIYYIPMIANNLNSIINSWRKESFDNNVILFNIKNWVKNKKIYEFFGEIEVLKKYEFNDSIILISGSNYFDKNKNMLQIGILIKTKKGKLVIRTNKQVITDNNFIYISNIYSLKSLLRPIKSLIELKSNNFIDIIINPIFNEKLLFTENFEKILSNLEYYGLNISQLDIINKILFSQNRIECIQGPPGTGKTKIIWGLIYNFIINNLENKKNKIKILICTPSNNAANEILKRIDDLNNKINFINNNIRVCRLMNEDNLDGYFNYKLSNIGEEIIYYYKNKINSIKSTIEIEKDEKNIFKLKKKLKNYYTKINKIKHDKSLILKKTDIIISTLNYAGSKILNKNKNLIDYLIIDEACQSLEPEILIPINLNPKKILLFGDPMQLPPTIFIKNKYLETSLFERFMDSNYKIHMLYMQYRMLPKLSYFSSKFFYSNKLVNHHSIKNKYKMLEKSNLILFNHEGKHMFKNKSYYNDTEINILINLIKQIKIICPKINISVISPYSSQKFKINKAVKLNNLNITKVSTIDGFQGKEDDIIIISCTKSYGNSIGFIKDLRRMNVLLTRCKYGLYIIGNMEHLKTNYSWNNLIEYINNEGKIINIENNNSKILLPINN